jgi:hypothetical protein
MSINWHEIKPFTPIYVFQKTFPEFFPNEVKQWLRTKLLSEKNHPDANKYSCRSPPEMEKSHVLLLVAHLPAPGPSNLNQGH